MVSAPEHRIVPVSPHARAARGLVRAYCERYGLAEHTSPATVLFGAHDGDGLTALVGYIDATGYRYVTDWYAIPGRRGVLGAHALVPFVRATPRAVVGWIVPANEAARNWVKKNGGSETLVRDADGTPLVAAICLPSEL